MDDVRAGRILRALRRRLGLTQSQLAERIGLSQQAISLVERGHGSKLSGSTLRRVFGAVDAHWDPIVTWRGGQLDRLMDEDHARLVGQAVRRLVGLDWEVAVEVTYSEYGERGSIDILGARRDLLVMVLIEVKTELTVLDATIRKVDEKERIVRASVGRRRFGFAPRRVGRLLILPSTETARRRVRGSAVILDAVFPSRGPVIRRWLRDPEGDLAGILFLTDTNPGSGTSLVAARNASADQRRTRSELADDRCRSRSGNIGSGRRCSTTRVGE